MYDIAIIGGGPAGYTAAFEAVKNRMSAVLFEQGQMGGTCLNRGCVPTKYLSHVARKYYEAKCAEADGLLYQGIDIDYSKTFSRMNGIVSELRDGLRGRLSRETVEIVQGEASIDRNRNVVCGGKTYEAKNILICTGAAPIESGMGDGVTSDDILKMNAIPRRLHIMGGGTVAVEFAEIFRMLGSEVTIHIRADRILRKWDKEIAVGLTQSMKKKGIGIEKNCDFAQLAFEKDSVILSALGRHAVLPSFECRLFDIGANGGIVVDGCGWTGTEGVYAAGDVVEGSLQLAHIGMEQGRRAVRSMAGLETKEAAVPVKCIYPDQEIASVGLTAAEAEEKGIWAISAKYSMYANARTVISTQERGFVKILAEKDSKKLIGAQLMCERAGDIAAELALAVNLGITVEEMLHSVRPHPSYAEAVTEALHLLEDKLNDI